MTTARAPIGLIAAVAIALGACSGTAAPTVAPTAPPTASPTPCVPASVGPSGSGGTVIKETALGNAFVTKDLTAPAASPFSIDFDNQDTGIAHNMDIRDACGDAVFKGDIISGPPTAKYHVPALVAGAYSFYCDIHPEMTGTLTVR